MEIIEIENKFSLMNDEKEKVGEIDFENDGSQLTITHTEVQKTLRKDGLGEKLVLSVAKKRKFITRSYMSICCKLH